jgi:hypothetical protein
MRYQAAATTPLGGLFFFFLCTALVMAVCLWLFALPAAAQEGPASGTPAQGTNPDSPSSPPDLATIAAAGCTVSEGASITLEDPDGTQALFVDGQLGIEITSTSEQITIVGPNDDYIGDHAVSSSDPGFDTAGDYAVVTTTGIACQGGGTPPDETETTGTTTTGTTTTGTPREARTLPGPGRSEGCDDPSEITTFSGTDNRRTEVFAVPSDVLRVRYLTEETDPDTGFLILTVTVIRANGDFVDSVLIFEPASGSQNVLLPGPGNYYLEIEAGDVRYELAIDACRGDIGPQPGPGPQPPGPPVGPGHEEIVFIPDRRLPNTGGPAILTPALALLISGAAIGLLLKRRW